MSLPAPVVRAARGHRVPLRSGPAVWLLCSLLVSLASPPALAQWKWRDGKGQVQYSDRPPPPGIPSRDILQKPTAVARSADPLAPAASAPPPAASAPRTVDPDLNARRREAEAAERKAAEDKLARERTESCTRARDYLRTLDSGMPIARVNAQGERVTLGEPERRAELARAREVIAADCR